MGGIIGAAIGAGSAKATSNAIGKLNKKNRQFAERMRNTAWQAGRRDMEKAGINPYFAFGTGGSGSVAAQTPSYQTFPGEGADYAGGIKAGVSSALDSMKAKAERKVLKNTAYKSEREGHLAGVKGHTETTVQNVNKANTQKSKWESARLKAETDLLRASLPAANTARDIENSPAGKAARWMERGLDVIGHATGAVGNLLGGQKKGRKR